MSERKATKKWVVDHVTMGQYGEVVPLRVDPEDGMFWFEYPEGSGNQYAGCDRKLMSAAARKVVRGHYHQTWTQHILVKTSTAYKQECPPQVGFECLARFERSVIEIKVPRYNNNSKGATVRDILETKRDKDPEGPNNEWYWRTVKNTSYRHFPGDEEYLYIGTHDLSFHVRGGVLLDYSDELWGRFLALYQACKDMHGKLGELMSGTPEEVAVRVLTNIGPGLLLGSGDPDLPPQ